MSCFGNLWNKNRSNRRVGGEGLDWNVSGIPLQPFAPSYSDAAGVVGCLSKALFLFTTLTSLSAPHAASGITAVGLGSPLPDFLLLHLGPVLGPERAHPHWPQAAASPIKPESVWKIRVKDIQEPGQRQGHRGVWSWYCLEL